MFENGGELPGGDHKYEIELLGTNHVPYQHNHIGLDLMRARIHAHRLVESTGLMRSNTTAIVNDDESEIANPCLARNTRRNVMITALQADRTGAMTMENGRTVMMAGTDVGGWEACNKDAIGVVKPCPLNGVYQPSLLKTLGGGRVLLLSYFDDRLALLHPKALGDDEAAKAASAQLTVGTIAEDTRTVCAGEADWQPRWGHDEKLMDKLRALPEWCLDLTFQRALLQVGYGFEASHPIAIENHIDGNELGWYLGATLAMLVDELVCRAD
jgi:guanosine-diphosphatase